MNKFELKQILEKNVATIVFTKVNGEDREMKCTLLSEYVPVKSEPQLLTEENRRQESDATLAVWDVEKQSWRSFRIDSIKDIRLG